MLKLHGYLNKGRHHFRYAEARAEVLLIGSGPVESAANHVVQQRMKRVGMRWYKKGADAMLVLRAAHRSTGGFRSMRRESLAASNSLGIAPLLGRPQRTETRGLRDWTSAAGPLKQTRICATTRAQRARFRPARERDKMLSLQLRDEFKNGPVKAMVELEDVAVWAPNDFLAITYPTTDLLRALAAIGPAQNKPVILLGERGQGKSHLLATLFHALRSPDAVSAWLKDWAGHLGREDVAQIPLRSGAHVIYGSLHQQSHPTLWDMVFNNHPDGAYFRGKWDHAGNKKTNVPPKALMAELFEKQPTALILDEFQTWYDTLVDTSEARYASWAFNFIQILSEIASEHPEWLVLAVSVRTSASEAYRQLHRLNPARIDFKGAKAREDRQRLLLHRLFENRRNIGEGEITPLVEAAIQEALRLRHLSGAEEERIRGDAIAAWPFTPSLLSLLEDQVLVATAAQETRDLITVLVELYRSRGEAQPFLTAGDLRVDADEVVVALIDSVANPVHSSLRDKAVRNLEAVLTAVPDINTAAPHLAEILSSLWVRSLAAGTTVGASASDLQLDVTRTTALDDNAFAAELATIVEHSFNIHQVGNRYAFKEEENPDTKLKAHARNDKFFDNGRDRVRIAREAKYVFTGTGATPSPSVFHVLPPTWATDPWCGWETAAQPDLWDTRNQILVLPETPPEADKTIGRFLKFHMQSRRNALRWLLPLADSVSIYDDRELLVLARTVVLAEEWKNEYMPLLQKYQRALREKLKVRWDRVAVLDSWRFQEPEAAKLAVEKLKVQGDKVAEAIEQLIRDNLFVHEDFDDLLLQAAHAGRSVADFLSELQEPRPNGAPCLPWLGEKDAKNRIAKACADGVIAINVSSTTMLQRKPDEHIEDAVRRIEGKLPSGKLLGETLLMLPQPVPVAGGEGPQPVTNPTPTVLPLPPTPSPSWPPKPITSVFTQKEATFKPIVIEASDMLTLRSKVKDTHNINAGTKVRTVVLRTAELTGSQLEKLIKDLPEGTEFALELEVEQPGDNGGGS